MPLVVTTFGKLGPAALGFLQSMADVACGTGVVDRGSRLRIAQQYLSCALVRGRGIVFRYYQQSMAARVVTTTATSARKDSYREKITSTIKPRS